MPVPKTGYYVIEAQNETATSTVSLPPILIPPNSDVRAHVMMVHAGHAGQTNTWGMDVYISQYVQDGVVHQGNFQLLLGHNITEIVLSAAASGATVVGTLLLEYF
jgi:hypothetical protein